MGKPFTLAIAITLCPALLLAGDGRIEISQADMSGPGPYTITKPGSYVLTEDLQVSTLSQGCITVATNDVTIDLNGFTIHGPGDGAVTAIEQAATFQNLCIANGTLRDWGGTVAINCMGSGNTAEGLRMRECAGAIRLGQNSLVRQCLAVNGEHGAGIEVGVASIVQNCVVDGLPGAGIDLGYSSIAENCVVTPANNAHDAAILGRGNCLIRNNVVTDAFGGGIAAFDGGNVIQGNTVNSGPAHGIVVPDPGNVVIRNAVTGIHTNFAVRASGNIAGPAFRHSTDHPLANFSFGDGRDRFEANDVETSATDLGAVRPLVERHLTIFPAEDTDWFQMTPTAAGTIEVTLKFVHAAGDIDCKLWCGPTVVATSGSSTDDEQLSAACVQGSNYFLEVWGFDGGTNGYELLVNGP